MATTQTLGRLLTRAWTRAWTEVRTGWRPPAAPDFSVELPLDHRTRWLSQLARTRYALEQVRDVVRNEGWTSGAWFTVATPSGSARPARTDEAFALTAPGSTVQGSCLVGALLRMADDPDQVPTVADAWHCVDELYEAIQESEGFGSAPPGRAYPHQVRRARLRVVTAWNDAPGRTPEQVLELLDRAVTRTIVGSCR